MTSPCSLVSVGASAEGVFATIPNRAAFRGKAQRRVNGPARFRKPLIHSFIAGVATAVTFFPATLSAAPIVYSFERRADTSAQFSTFSPNIGLNAGGTVVFQATQDATLNLTGIFTVVPGGTPVELVNTAGPFSDFDFSVAINAVGAVAFHGTLDDGSEGIFTVARGAAPVLVARSGQDGFAGFGRPTLNASGTVAFVGFGGGVRGIYTAPAGGTPVQRLSNAGPFDAFYFNAPITDAGRLAFTASLDNGSGSLSTLEPDGSLAEVANTDGPIVSLFNQGQPAVTDTGRVAFAAQLDLGGEAVYLEISGGSPVEVLNTDGVFEDFLGVDINAAGLLAFGAIVDGENTIRLFVQQPGESPQQLIGAGDTLDGSLVAGVSFGFPLLNDAGQIAFVAYLEDGRQGIYVASPVPEPFGLGVVGAVMLTVFRRQRVGGRRT